MLEEIASVFVFFFQAEDGIRDLYVTGVQTCALPIWEPSAASCAVGRTWIIQKKSAPSRSSPRKESLPELAASWPSRARRRSEERRVGKECRYRGRPER